MIPFRLYVYAAVLLALIGGGLYLRHHWIEEGAQEWRGKYHTAIAANKTQADTIRSLKAANKQWAAKYATDLAATKAAADAALAYYRKQQAVAKAVKGKLHDLYQTMPAAHAWAATRVPAAVAVQLRDATGTH